MKDNAQPSIVNAQFKPYEKYKDSGVEWLGGIPSEWNLKPGFVAYCENKRNNKGLKEERVLSLSYGNIVVKPKEKLVGLVPESFETYQIVEPDDIIIRCMDLQNDKMSLRTGLSKNHGIITSAYLNLKVNDSYCSKYLYYYLHSLDTTKVLYKFGTGLRQNLSFQDFYRLPVFDIPKAQQTAIAEFLDEKTGKIDEAIAIKQKQIELLKERKQILIQNAVTRGLDPHVKLKESGIPWIGQIPEHWEVKTLKYITKIRYGLGQPPKEKEDGLPIIRATNVERGLITEKGLLFVDPDDIPWDRNPVLRENEIIVVRSGAYTGDSARIPKEYDGAITGYDMVMTPFGINSKFLSVAMLAKYVLFDQLYLLRMRSAQPHLNADELGNTLVLYPPVNEQEDIVTFLEKESSKFDQALNLQQQQIEKLKEYKSTLINSAVTGKIKLV